MKISLVCVGKIKEKYLTEGIAEFTKRLMPYCKLETIAIGEEKMPDNPSPAEKEQVLAKETGAFDKRHTGKRLCGAFGLAGQGK